LKRLQNVGHEGRVVSAPALFYVWALACSGHWRFSCWYESTMKQLAMYRDIEISERQIEAGQVKDARMALKEMRTKYGL